MTRALVGHSGFVGTNLLRQASFNHLYNSRNIGDIADRHFDTLVVAAVPASMWLANNRPALDLANIERLSGQLCKVKARQAVLISTIAVYADPATAPDETNEGGFEVQKPYGSNRRQFEEILAEHFTDLLTIRLPALFGPGLAKNFVFDLLNPIPTFLPGDAMDRVREKADVEEKELLERAFALENDAGVWRFDRAAFGHGETSQRLEAMLDRIGIDARNFTNGASRFQFYNLSHLWSDIERGLAAGLSCLNLATEPLQACDVAQRLTGRPFVSHEAPLVLQDMRTRHARHWQRDGAYLYSADQLLDELVAFYRREKEG